jgi:hypothetical protein
MIVFTTRESITFIINKYYKEHKNSTPSDPVPRRGMQCHGLLKSPLSLLVDFYAVAKPPANAISWWPKSIPAFVKH